MDVEEALRTRHEMVKANIRRDEQVGREYARYTKLQTSDHKRIHSRIAQREQREWCKLDEHRMIANLAGIEL